ncbi:MAG TPA: hypothetical protein VJH23_05810 [archaeon]|nr:hypothetical protein [archaeon]
MGFVKNALDAAIISLAFYFGTLALGGLGLDIIRDSILTPIGATVTFLLAFMETTYNRF